MTTLEYQNCGTSFAIFIEGDSLEEIQHRYYSLWNWKATNGELAWLTDSCARIWTDKARLIKYFENISLMELINTRPNDFKKKKGGALEEAKRLALEKFNALKERKGYIKYDQDVTEYNEHGSVSAEKPDEDLKSYFIMRGFGA